MDIDSRTGSIFVLDESNDIAKFKDGKLLEKIRVTNAMNKTYNLIRVHPSTGQLYLLNQGTKEMVILDDWQPSAHVPVGERAGLMEIDPFTGNVYVANFFNATITVINGTKVLDTLQMGASAIGINPNNGWVYVANTAKQTVTVLGYPSPNSIQPTPTKSAYPPPNYTPPAPTKIPTAPTIPTRTPTTKPYP